MTTSYPANDSFRPDINALRALAVLSVVFFHFDMFGAVSGYIGVDVFFVISGFLIGGQVSSQIRSGQFKLSAFMVGRIRRILPALLVVCIAIYLWGWLYMLPSDYVLLARNILAVVSFVSNIAFANQQGYFDLGAQYNPLLHTWSLSVEAQFYLLLPIVLVFAFKWQTRMRLLAATVLATASFTAALVIGSGSPDTVFFAFAARAWEFLVGCLVAWFTQSASGRLVMQVSARKALLAIVWAALIASAFWTPKGVVWPGLWTLLPVLLAASIIMLGIGHAAGSLVSNPIVQHVGTISYSLYLWHWPLIVCWKIMNSQQGPASGLALWGLLAATWGLALLSWRFVESPVRNNRRFWTARKLYAAYGAAFLALTVISATIWRLGGVPSRWPEYLHGAITASHFKPPLNKRCWGLPRAEDNSYSSCDFGNPSEKPSLAIWGDSHGLHFLEVLRQTLDGGPVSGILFHRPGCEPTISNLHGVGLCDVHNEEVLKHIENTPSIKTVIIAIRQNDPIRVDRASNTVQRLLEKNYKVIYLGPLPEAKQAVAQEWATTQFLTRKPVMEMTLARSAPTRVQSFDQRLLHWRTSTEAISTRFPKTFIALDLTNSFCDASKCWFVRDGVGLFWDADHLTLAGARLVLPAVLRAVEAP